MTTPTSTRSELNIPCTYAKALSVFNLAKWASEKTDDELRALIVLQEAILNRQQLKKR